MQTKLCSWLKLERLVMVLYLVTLPILVIGLSPVASASTTYTFYPDAHPETNTVDGYTIRLNAAGEAWANLVAGAGTHKGDSETGDGIQPWAVFSHAIGVNDWIELERMFFLFDTSSIPDDYVISSATLSIYLISKSDTQNWQPSFGVYSTNPASNTALVPADYGTFGSTLLSTVRTYTQMTTASYNPFILNSSGLNQVDATGITKLGIRNVNYDAAGAGPAWVANKDAWLSTNFAEKGAGFMPTLTVVANYPPSQTGTVILQSLLRVVLAGAILVGVIMIGRRGGTVVLLAAAIIGLIAFVIINSIISTLL